MRLVWLCILWRKQFEDTFKYIQQRKMQPRNMINMTLHLMMRPIWRNIWKHTIEKSPINQCNQCDYELGMAMRMQEKFIIFYYLMRFMRIWCASMHFGKIRQWILSCVHCVQFEDSFENAHWRKVKQVQPVQWDYACSDPSFSEKGVYCVAALRGIDDK